ncbi:MAG: 6,7-dimethyl-8-ribityllumazine synthase, partial [Muribaculaceae bacterium]|nr:6,7-dimethyl-8-ribityllumazine synthase [Muribaculaceae bacterium]
MSTNSIQTGLQQPLPKLDGMRVAIVSTLWNAEVTDRLRDGALEVFRNEGFDKSQVKTFQVPGAVEL